MKFIFKRKRNRGTTAIEYCLIAALIAVVATNVMGAGGRTLIATFDTIAVKLCLGTCVLVQQSPPGR